jgi:hypothetical protein
MNQQEAMDIVDKLAVVIQKARSNAIESAAAYLPEGADVEKALETTDSWLFGPKCLLIGLLKVQGFQKIEPQSFFNLMFVCYRLAPELAAIYAAMVGEELPKPTIELMKGLME